jgi:3-hydroxymyristoyl/3-hydroxydecanoyl-(acyl carrier protein) dehydratase
MASPEKIMANEQEILELIPQRAPMVMVGRLLQAEENRIVSSFLIGHDNIFCENGYFREAGIVENIAQTAAAGTGYRYRLLGKTPPPGFIGGIKNLVIQRLPEPGMDILTEVTIEHEILNATVITGKVTMEGILVASCEMKIFLIAETGS